MGLIDDCYGLLLEGEFWEFYRTLFNSYFAYGFIFPLFGFVIFGVIHMKSKNMAYSGAVTAVYFLGIGTLEIMTNAFSVMAMTYFGLFIAIIIAIYMYRSMK
jgi:hypothetical protein